MGERRAERNVDPGSCVDGPAVGVEDRPEIALAELEPRQHHGRTGNEQEDAQHSQGHPHAQAEKGAHDAADHPADAGRRDTQGRNHAAVQFWPLVRRLARHRGLLGCERGRGQLFGRSGVRRRSPFGDLFFDKANDFLVGGPKRLPDANGLVHNPRDGGVPIAALSIVENAIAPNHEIVRITVGKGGGDGHFLARALARELAVSQISF